MNIPAQVQAQADKADQLIKDASNPETHTTGQTAPGSPESHNAQPSPEETVEYWKNRFEVVQGKYNSEVQALKNDVTLLNTLKNQTRQQMGQIQEQNLLIVELQKQLAEKPKAAGDDTGDSLMATLSEDDREYLEGEGFTDKTLQIIVGKLAAKAKPAEQAKGEQPNPATVEDPKATAERLFWSELVKAVPDWEPINAGNPFNDWLDATVPYTRKTRRDVLKDAQADNDFVTVIQMFFDFKATLPAPKEEESKPKIDPAQHIEPSSSVGRTENPEGGMPKGKTYTQAEVNKFYAAAATEMGSNRTTKARKDEIATMDADIMLAAKEGRIVG